MNREGHLCFSAVSSSRELVFSQSSDPSKAGHLVFFKNQGDWTQVTFAWGADLTDLDICAYWEGAPEYTFGYKQKNETPPSPYNIKWSDDETGTGVSEWCQIWKSSWKGGSNVFRVHFNYFRSVPAGSVCTVIANQRGGETKILIMFRVALELVRHIKPTRMLKSCSMIAGIS